MAIVLTHLEDGADTSNNPCTTASITPTANVPILIAVISASTAFESGTITITGCGITWTSIGSIRYGTRRILHLFKGVSASPSSGSLTITETDYANWTETMWAVTNVAGADTTTPFGTVYTNDGTTVTSLTVAVGGTAPVSADGDMVFACFGLEGASQSPTLNAELDNTLVALGGGSDCRTIVTAYDSSPDSSPTPGLTFSSCSAGGIGLVIWAAAGGGSTLLPNKCSVAITGLDANISAGKTISGTTGSVSISGIAANVSAGKTISGTLGAIAISGINPNISAGKTIACTTGAVVATGLQGSIPTGETISVTSGGVSIAGINPDISAGKTISGTLGAIAVTGLAATVSNDSSINCSTGAIAIAGFAADVSAGSTIAVTTGNITVAGINADVSAGGTIAVSAGAIAITGLNADITHTVLIEPTTGAIIITGLAASISSGEIPDVPAERIYSIPNENRIYAIT